MKDRFKRFRDILDHYEEQQQDRHIELRMYKARWIWYHTILGVELFAVFLVLLGIYFKL